MSYGNQNTWSGDSIFEDVYIYGKLNYDFRGDADFRDSSPGVDEESG